MNELLAPRTPGAALKTARERHGLSIAEVAASTRIKSHIITALENDDYTVIAAPLYGKGFLKIYAERVGLDPEPLVNYYLSYYARTVRPTLQTEVPPPTPVKEGIPVPSTLARFHEARGSAVASISNSLALFTRDALQSLAVTWARMQALVRVETDEEDRYASRRARREAEPMPVGRYAAIGVAAMVVVILVASLVYLLAGRSDGPAAPVAPGAVAKPKIATVRSLRVAEPPPAPYIKLPK